MPNSLRRSSSEPSLGSPRAFRRVLQSLSKLRPLIAHRLRRPLTHLPSRRHTPSYTPSQSASDSSTPLAPSPFSPLDEGDLIFTRRDLRLKFLQCGPATELSHRVHTRQEILAEIRQVTQLRERRPLRSPTNPAARPTRSETVFTAAPPTALPRRRPRGGGRDVRAALERGVVTFATAAPAPRRPVYAQAQWDSRASSRPQPSSGSRLTVRDMRQIDPSFTAKPAIWVREEALVVSLESVRAIILSDRVFLFDPDNQVVKASLWNIQKRLAHNLEDAFMPFEFRALEGILIHACSLLERDFSAIEPELRHTLINLPLRISNEELERLHVLEQRLNQFYARARKVQQAIQAVLDEDEDMSEMYLTEKRKNPGILRNPLDHDEAEMLLETYLQMVDDLTSRAGLLNQAIDDTENLIEIHLDTMQNRVLLVGLIISANTTTLSFATMVTAIFGMNMPFPKGMGELPSSKYYFFGTIVITFLIMVVGLFLLTRWCRRAGLYAGREEGSTYRRASDNPAVFKATEDGDRKSGCSFGHSRQSESFGLSGQVEYVSVSKSDQIDEFLDEGKASVDIFKPATGDMF